MTAPALVRSDARAGSRTSARTSCPSLHRRFARTPPRNPVAPVTKYFIDHNLQRSVAAAPSSCAGCALGDRLIEVGLREIRQVDPGVRHLVHRAIAPAH